MSPIKWIVLPLHNRIPSIITEQRKSNLFVETWKLWMPTGDSDSDCAQHVPGSGSLSIYCLPIARDNNKILRGMSNGNRYCRQNYYRPITPHSVCAINLHLPPHSPPLVMFRLSLSLSSCPLFCCYRYIGCSWLTEWMTGHFTATSQSILFVFHPT